VFDRSIGIGPKFEAESEGITEGEREIVLAGVLF